MGGTRTGRIGNLPVDITTFVGRGQELARARAQLAGCRLVTLIGVGGVGKTRLAVRIASELTRAFSDGVWLIEFAALHDAELVPATIAAALGGDFYAERGGGEALSQYLADREALLILDNCEHLIDGCAAIAAELLQSCPGVRILATSRQPLGISGEHVFSVPPLDVPKPSVAASVRAAGEYAAVRLLVERAAAAQPGFSLTAENRGAIIEICRRLDGIPLALELAARRLRALSPAQLQDRLHDRYSLLTGGSRTALPRQQTLRALIDWSYDLCTPTEQLLWGRLSVFEDGFDLTAAESICSDDAIPEAEMLYVIAGLVDKSIISTAEDGSELRYYLSETMQEYGHGLLEDADRDRLDRRHRDWYSALVAAAEASWFSAQQVQQFTRLRREHANLRAALKFSLRDPVDAGVGLTMAAGLRFYWLMSGHVAEGVHWIDRLLAAHRAPDVARLKGLRVQAHLGAVVWDGPTIARLLDEAAELAEHVGDPREAAYLLQSRGLVELFRGDAACAAATLEEAFRRHDELGDEAAAAYDRIQTSLAVGQLGDAERAVELVESVLPTCRARGDHWITALALFALGVESCRQGECARATELQRESLQLRLPLDDQRNVGLNFEGLAWSAVDSDEAERAAALFGASLSVQEAVGTSLRGLRHLYALHTDYEPRAREALGDDRFEQLRTEGHGWSFAEAVAFAMGDSDRPPAEPHAATGRLARPPAEDTSGWGALTKRERQVAELVADGLTNKEIAARLIISIRTVEGHVENVLAKRNFTSRAQVAAWIATQRAHEG